MKQQNPLTIMVKFWLQKDGASESKIGFREVTTNHVQHSAQRLYTSKMRILSA